MKCKNCGTDNASMTAYCGVCGAPLEGNEFQQVPDNTSVENYPESPKKKKKGLKIAIIIISVVLVLTLGIVAVIGVGIAAVIGLYNVDASEDIYSPDAYEESIGGDIFDEEFDFGELNPEDYVSGDFSSFNNLEDYCGMYYEGDNENGPCYAVNLISFDDSTNVAVIDVNYVGINASPYYSTGEITVILDDEGFAEFEWDDSWYNSGYGSVKFVTNSGTPYVEVNMTQTVTSDFNRSSLATSETKVLFLWD